MKNLLLLLFFFFSISVTFSQNSTSATEYRTTYKTVPDSNFITIATVNWNMAKIYPGVYYGYSHFTNLFGANQSVSIINIKMDSAAVEVTFPWVKGRELTSAQATKANAIAAVNGTFFNVKLGGSIEYLKVNDTVITETLDANMDIRDEGAISVLANGKVEITSIPQNNSWQEFYTNHQYLHMMAAGPMILDEFQEKNLAQIPFNLKRHPRTLVCVKPNNIFSMITVDGRTSMAAGMSIVELQVLTKALGCKDALNLDGGGSTSMWIAGKPDNGIVNYPSDNRKFDHAGERTCANIIAIVPKVQSLKK